MDTETIDPRFMKALMRCYLLQKKAKKRVFYNRQFFHQVLKVYKWQNRIKSSIEAAKSSDGKASSSNEFDLPQNHLSPKNQVDEGFDNEKICVKEERNSPPSPPPLSPRSSPRSSPLPSAPTSSPPESLPESSKSSSSSLQDSKPASTIVLTASTTTPQDTTDGYVAMSETETCISPPIERSTSMDTTNQIPVKKLNSSIALSDTNTKNNTLHLPQTTSEGNLADFDIVRRNLWLMIVRQDIALAYKRKVSFREHKILKTRAIAHRCQLHSKDFHRLKQQHRDEQQHLQNNGNKHKQD